MSRVTALLEEMSREMNDVDTKRRRALTSATDLVLHDVSAEVARARRLFPNRKHLLAALVEEVGELARAYLDNEGSSRVRAEAIQVACMAVRIAVEGEETFDGWEKK